MENFAHSLDVNLSLKQAWRERVSLDCCLNVWVLFERVKNAQDDFVAWRKIFFKLRAVCSELDFLRNVYAPRLLLLLMCLVKSLLKVK